MTETRLRIGLLRLTDSAPVLHAEAAGLFARHGLAAELSIEPSWANIADKLAYGLLDAAVMLPPLALAAAAGLRGAPARIVVPMGLTLGGNALVGTHAVAEAVGAPEAGAAGAGAMAQGRRFVAWLRARPSPPRFAVVHAWSTHHLLLRYWLAAAGGDPDRDLAIVVIPPEQVVAALASGRIIGFCAGAPWGDAAEAAGDGVVLLGSSAIWGHHPEKCLALAEPWAQAHPDAVTALLRALLAAGRACARAEEAPALAGLLAEAGIAAPRRALLAALPGGAGQERIGFHDGAAWFPWLSHARWFLAQLQRWGWLAAGADAAALARAVYRPDLLAPAAAADGLDWPLAATKPEGGHVGPWLLPAAPHPIAMGADRFCDGAVIG
jgi:two-component system, oxyanion-binding sensor